MNIIVVICNVLQIPNTELQTKRNAILMILGDKWLRFAAHLVGKIANNFIRFHEICLFVFISGYRQDKSSRSAPFLYNFDV